MFLKGYIEKKGVQDAIVSGIRFFLASSSILAKVLGWIIEQVGEAIDLLKIPDKFWDDQNENYAFTKENLRNSLTIDTSGFVNQVLQADASSISDSIAIFGKANFEKQIDFFTTPVSKIAQAYNAYVTQMLEDAFAGLENHSETTEKIKQDFALVAGLWNGLVDFVSSTLKLIGNLAQAGFDIANNWEEFLETMDNILDSLANINFAEIWQGIKLLYNKVITYINEADGLNWVRIAYMTGYSISFIGTMFIPIVGWIGKIAKVDKLIPNELLDILRKSGEALATNLTTKTSNAQLKILQQCDELLQIFAKGRQAIKDFFTKLAEDIGKWLVKNRKVVSLVDELDSFLLPFIKILRKNTKYLDSIQYIKLIRRPLGKWLTVEQEAVVNLYTKSYYIYFNRALRKIEGKMTEEYKAMQKVLDNALGKLPISKHNKNVLLRSTYFSEESIKKLFKVGGDFTDAGYFSTTYSESALIRWMKSNPNDNVLFKVYGKNGKLIEESSNVIPEAEVLFKSNTTFFVESVIKIKHPIPERTEKIFEIILKEK